MDVRLQRSPTTRRVGAENSSHSVLSQADDSPGTACEVSKGLGDTAGPQQRTDQVARTEAVCRRSVCGVSRRAEAQEPGDLGSPLCRIADWPTVGIRSRRNPPSKVLSPVLKRWIVWRVGGQAISSPTPSPGLPLRFGSLRSPKRSGSPGDAPYCPQENQSSPVYGLPKLLPITLRKVLPISLRAATPGPLPSDGRG